MDMVAIQCPNCGGRMERKEKEYFAKCPYCGSEVCFDEIKEEVQVDVYRDKAAELEQENNLYKENQKALQRWLRIRNIVFVITGLCHFLGFAIFAYDTESEAVLWIGMIFLIIAWTVFFVFMPALSLSYPNYNIVTGKKESIYKWKMWLKLSGIGLGIFMVTAIGAVIVMHL
ncbi:MAG: hypothetical protein J6M66_01330 [Lachnospiraceae bacterium]|nr:hypothetical protein [Lachnospiraceae bacterium]